MGNKIQSKGNWGKKLVRRHLFHFTLNSGKLFTLIFFFFRKTGFFLGKQALLAKKYFGGIFFWNMCFV